LARSFTGFLVRRYGWERYRKFYRRSHALNFKGYFQKVFGVSFEKAEWQWRSELQLTTLWRQRLEGFSLR
jgi:hypothetical protein